MTLRVEAAAAGGSRTRRVLLWTLGWLVLTALVIVSLRTVNWSAVWQQLRTVSAPWLVVAAAFNFGILVCWALLWRVFVPVQTPVRFGRMFSINALTASIMNTTPLLVGHASGAAMLVRRAGLAPSAAVGVLALDQLYEGLAKVSLFVLAALLLPLPDWMRRSVIGVAIAVGVLLALLLVSAHRHREGVVHEAGPHVPGKLRAFLAGFARDLEALRSWRRAGLALVFAIAMKASEGAAIVAVQHAFGVVLPLRTAPLVLAAVILATMIPLSPGNLGPYEAATVLAYRWLGLPTAEALGIALVQHLMYLLPILGTGYAKLTWDILRGQRPTSPRASSYSS